MARVEGSAKACRTRANNRGGALMIPDMFADRQRYRSRVEVTG